MLKKIRVALAAVFWTGITLLLLDVTGVLHGFLGWMAKVQFLPAVMAMNVAVIVGLVLLTLVFGRVYCSMICPLGVFQDGISHVGTRRSKHPYRYRKENKELRYSVWVVFVLALVLGIQVFVALLAPYSAYGRMVQSLLQPLWLRCGNLIEALAEKAGTYAVYPHEVWMRSLPTFVVAALTLVVIVVLSFKGGRIYCETICPVGTTLSFLSRFAMFRPVIDADKCTHCKACSRHCKAHCIEIEKNVARIDYARCVDCFNCLDECQYDALKYKFAWGKDASAKPQHDKAQHDKAQHDKAQHDKPQHDKAQEDKPAGDNGRRAMLTGTVLAVGAAALKSVEGKAQSLQKVDGGLAELLPKRAPERDLPVTPPGSLSIKDFYRRCTVCELCVAECPSNVLRPSTSLEHLMQPELSFERGYCRIECTRCSELCPTGAIRKINKEEKTEYHVGTARVNRNLCVSEQGVACGKCAEVCPTGAVILQENLEGMRIPVVSEAVCIGCGACEFYCPSRPYSAISVNGKNQHV